MTIPPTSSEQAARDLVKLTKEYLIGQDAAVEAFAAEICQYFALDPLQRRPGVYLVAGSNFDDDHFGLAAGLADFLKSRGSVYRLSSAHGDDMAHFFRYLSDGTLGPSLTQMLKEHPHGVFILQDIEQARPSLLGQLKNAWSRGFVEDEAGEVISLRDTIFFLTTEVAQEMIGQIARSERDPDRLHVEALKALIDARFPTSIIRSINAVFCLQYLTPGEVARESYRSLAEQVALHGLALDEGGIDARILTHAMDPSIEPYVSSVTPPRAGLDQRLAEAKAGGVRSVRLVLGNEIIRVVPVGEST